MTVVFGNLKNLFLFSVDQGNELHYKIKKCETKHGNKLITFY